MIALIIDLAGIVFLLLLVIVVIAVIRIKSITYYD